MRLFQGRKQRTLDLLAPASGDVVELADVPDPVFAQSVLGPGFAVIPSDGVVRAPIAGTVGGVLPSRHAIYIETKDAVQVLVHVGLDTVRLEGRHFTALVAAGEEVSAGQPVIEWDRAAVATEGFSTHIPVCLVEPGPYATVESRAGTTVVGGELAAVAGPGER